MTGLPQEPLSWLTLERYALGELDRRVGSTVEERLRRSARDRVRLASILNDASELPPLPSPRARTRKRSYGWFSASSGLLAAAAALALLFAGEMEGSMPPARRVLSEGTKGGEVAVALVGERSGENATHFAQGERFKLLVTLPHWFRAELRVFVFQAGARYEPLAAQPIASGNLVPWPGAFSLDGNQEAQICVAWGARAQSATSAQDLGADAVCTRLSPQ